MYELSEFKRKALLKAQRLTTKNSNNILYTGWRKECIESNGFLDGKNQWPEKLVQILRARGQDIVVLNKLKPLINQICGLEINTRTKIAYRTHSGRNDAELLAKGLTHWGFAIQEMEDFSYKGSLRARDALTGGLGWVRLFSYEGKIIYEYVNSLDIIYDADDFSPQLEKMDSVQHMRFLSLEQKKSFWPKHAKIFEEIDRDDSDGYFVGNFSSELWNRQSDWIFPLTESYMGGKTPVIECQYKEPRKYYCSIDNSGYYFETFDEEKADKLSPVKSDIEEKTGTQIMRTVFYKDILLDHSPLYPNIPNCKNFSYIPLVWDRRLSDSLPIGIVDGLKDLQRGINYLNAKNMNALNSVRVVMPADAMLPGQSLEDVRDEAARPDGVFLETRENEVKLIPNVDLAASYLRQAERNDKELQQISGIYSDSLGEPTNAQSGIAIKQRQIGSAKNFAYGFDAFGYVKKREGKMLLDQIQGGDFENMDIQILDDDEMDAITLNLVREIDGEKVIFNDVRTLPVDVYVERVPDYDSSPEEQQATLEALLANPSAPLILQNPELLKLLRFRYADKIAGAMQKLQQQQTAMEQGGNMPLPAPQNQQEAISPVPIGGKVNG